MLSERKLNAVVRTTPKSSKEKTLKENYDRIKKKIRKNNRTLFAVSEIFSILEMCNSMYKTILIYA